MLLISIDDYTLPTPATITKDSAHLNFGVDRRAGLYSSVFFGNTAQAASWEAKITLDSQADRDALMAVLTVVGEGQVRLVADLDVDGVVGEQLVTIDAAVGSVKWPGSGWNLTVTFESDDSFWTGLDVETVSKTFSDPLDQVVLLPAPGNVPTQPVIRLLPTVQRAAPTAAVGWSLRQRIAVANASDEPWFRYEVRLPLGDTNQLVNAGKALANGADLRVWLHGLEQSRTLVDWNTSESYCWVVIPALPAGEAITYEIVYGNAQATLSDGVELVYPERPAHDISLSTNYLHHYRSERALANAALGLWRLSSAREGGSADYGVPGGWSPALTWENPNNSDSYVQPAAQRIRDGGDEWYQPLLFASRWRGPGFTDIEAYQGSDPYDGVVLYNPLGIRAVVSEGIRWRNDAALKTIVTTTVGDESRTDEVLVPHDPYTRVVVLGRNSGGEAWHVLTEYGQPQGGGDASRLYLPSGGAAAISPAFAGDWDETASADRVAAVASKSGSAMADKAAAFTSFTLAAPGHFTFDTTFGSAGSGNNQFSNPELLATDASGNLFIADTGNNRVKKHDAAGTYVSSATVTSEPHGIHVNASNRSYVTYRHAANDYRVRQFSGGIAVLLNDTGNIGQTAALRGLTYIPPTPPSLDGAIYAVAGAALLKIAHNQFTNAMTLSATWGSAGSGDGQFSSPTGIVTDGTHLYVADTGNDRVQKFTLAGAYVAQWGGSGTGDGQFDGPTGIAIHPVTGHIYVADTGNDRIQCFTAAGQFLAAYDPGTGSSAGELNTPTGLAFAPDGAKLYCSEVGNDRITVLDVAWDFSGLDLLLRQYIYPLDAGVEFSTADTVKGQVRAATETGTNARAQRIIRVVSSDGTVRATLLGVDGAAMDNAFATDLTNREFPRDAPQNLEANYTTVAGDYLVVEDGARFGTHTALMPGATLRFGDTGETDLPEDETETDDLVPWIEFSTDLWPDVGEIHTEAATWTPPQPVKHFGIACWPKGGVSIPDNAESRVLVESDGDITVHVAAEPLVITKIEDEVEIYELATELRLHGGGNAVGPYDTLLVGNARGLSGPGTPRAAVVLGAQGLQIDTERHTHALWDAAFAAQVEALPTHAVRALTGSLRDIDAADIPALERLPAVIPNSAFASDLTGWEQHATDGDWSYTVTHDPAVGGAAPGSLRFTLATTDAATVLWRSTTYVAVEETDSIEATCWVRQTDSGATAPRLGIAWYDATPTLLGVSLNAASDIALNPALDHELSFAGTPPEGATQGRVVLGVTAVGNAPGSKWFDDVAVAVIRPLRYDGSVAKVTEEQRSSRWLPVAPPRRAVPNGDFAADIAGWALEDDGTGITQSASHDPAVGGAAVGSLKVAISANSGADSVVYRTAGFFAVAGAERVEMSAWCVSDDEDLHPRLAILWYRDGSDTLLATALEDDWQPEEDAEYERSFAAIVPPGMTRFRLGLVVDTSASATGNVWFDDIKLNDNALLVADAALGEMALTALVPPRFTP